MNTTVTATGMSVHSSVGSNLLIANVNTNDGNKLPDSKNFHPQFVASDISGYLMPVSSVNGTSFYYTNTTNVGSNGDATSDSYIDYTSTGIGKVDGQEYNKFNANYGNTGTDKTYVAYVDYTFVLQAVNASSGKTQNINMTACDLVYAGNSTAGKAFRLAMLVQDYSNASFATNIGTKTILGCYDEVAGNSSNSDYFTKSKDSNKPQAVTSTTALADVSNYNSAATVGTVAAGATAYFKVTLRLWLEGEDTTCNNTTYALLTDNYNLTVKFDLQDDASVAKKNIKLSGTATKINLAGYTASTSDNLTIGGTIYYAYTKTNDTTIIYCMDNSVTVNSKWYKIEGQQVTDITNIVTGSITSE